MNIYLRPLEIKDAEISYHWRNNPVVWELTGSKPDKFITKDMEVAWIKKVLARSDEKRYAICLSHNDQYIGNVQLTSIKNRQAEFHIFIGLPEFWGKGIGKLATAKMINIGFSELQLKKIYLFVKKNNLAAIKAYEKVGFKIMSSDNDQYYMEINND